MSSVEYQTHSAEKDHVMLIFPDVEQRMILLKQNEWYPVIEDYAHHPAAPEDSISTFRKNYSGNSLFLCFNLIAMQELWTEFGKRSVPL